MHGGGCLKKKVLVAGGAGYVGCVLVPKLLDAGYEVIVYDLMLFGSDGLCYSCHQKEPADHMFEAGFSHPIGIPIKRERVTGPLPITRVKGLGDVVTCTSCHDPHSRAGMMLRIPTANDQLCLACHRFE